jgi:hypothetical protein
MPDAPGPFTPLAVNGALLAVPLLPLLMALALALLALGRTQAYVGRIWTVGPTLASTGLLGFLGAYTALGREPATMTLAHGVTLVRVGWLDVGFDVAFDRLAGAFALAGGAFFAAVLSWLGRDGASGPRPLASLALGNLASGAFFFALVADAAPAFVFGSGASALAAAWLAARSSARPRGSDDFAHRAFGEALLGLGLVALAASFFPDTDEAAGAPLRVVPVSRPDDPARPKPSGRPNSGYLTASALPGATLRTEGSPSLSALTAPVVRNATAAGSYRGRIVPGPGSLDVPFGPARVAENAETRLVLAGPTAAFRTMEEQATLLSPAEGPPPSGVALARAGVALVAAGALLRGAYAGSGRTRARGGGLAWLGAAPSALLGAYLLLRLSFAWRPPSASLVGLGFGAAFAASAGALGARRPADAAGALVALCLGLAVASAGAGAPGAVFAFGLAPALVAAALLARSSPLAPDPEPGARPLAPAWAVPFALLGVVGVSSLVGRLPFGSAAGLALLFALTPPVAAAALLVARALGLGDTTIVGVATAPAVPRGEGLVLACVVAPLALLGAEPWFGLVRAKAPALQWASPVAAWGSTRPLAAIGSTVGLGLVAWFAARWAQGAGIAHGDPAPSDSAAGTLVRKAWRALGSPSRALWVASAAIDRRLWGVRSGAPGPRPPSGAQ